MILKTYARLFVRSLDDALPVLESLVGRPADLRFWSDDPKLLDSVVDDSVDPLVGSGEVEQAAIGDFLVIAGEEGALARARQAVGPVVVADLEKTTDRLMGAGATMAVSPTKTEIGVFNYLRHPDGSLVEYIQWKSELVSRIIGLSKTPNTTIMFRY